MRPGVLRQLADVIARPLCILSERSWRRGEVPEAWKKDNVTPLFQNGKKEHPGNYRPVSLTSIPAKVPEVTVFSEDSVELGDPNMLICYVDKFWPPLITIKWLKNGQEVVDGIVETVFYPCQDHTFRKFSYLPFIRTWGDSYDCRMDHWGLPDAWVLPPLQASSPSLCLPRGPVSESTKTLVCALGLAVGIVGIIVGTVLIIKAMKMNSVPTRTAPCERVGVILPPGLSRFYKQQ
ncbi:HLA class II histocompatibility antigen, DR alpha chain-like [Apteryx mantelli]|uniref:HLA class II histocompatibility antigen, DR alpha chain-like n=1 Tax=Apteryx mantelli TaxID=2696672 RepID=A0ABM4FXT3_9AVES